MKAKATRSTKPRESTRRVKKKVSILVQESVDYIDWKDVNLLRRFVSDRAKVRARRVTGNSTQQQRQVAAAIKVAREMALLPYSSRVTTQRGRPRRDDDGERRPRRDRDAPSEEFAEIGGPDSADSAGLGENGAVESGEVVQSGETEEVGA